jgi:hypothetical protein
MLSNLIAQSPDALAAQKEQKAADRKAREEYIDFLTSSIDEMSNPNAARNFLGYDVKALKDFYKKRLASVKSSTSMTQDQLDALNGNKESQNYENLRNSLKLRKNFQDEFVEIKKKYTRLIFDLESKKQTVPDNFRYAIKLCDEALIWLNKSPYESPDVYADKRNEILKKFQDKSIDVPFDDPNKQLADLEAKNLQAREKFDTGELLGDAFGKAGKYVAAFLLFVAVILGASLATNLNLYRNAAFRTLYAMYGGVFFFIVIPYCLLYRWAWNGMKPKFYSLIPLYPYHWNNRIMQILFGWISYRPDDEINLLKEWEHIGA